MSLLVLQICYQSKSTFGNNKVIETREITKRWSSIGKVPGNDFMGIAAAAGDTPVCSELLFPLDMELYQFIFSCKNYVILEICDLNIFAKTLKGVDVEW